MSPILPAVELTSKETTGQCDMTFPTPVRCCRKHWTLALFEKPWGLSLHSMTGVAVVTSDSHAPPTSACHSLEPSCHLSRLMATDSSWYLPMLADLGVCKRNCSRHEIAMSMCQCVLRVEINFWRAKRKSMAYFVCSQYLWPSLTSNDSSSHGDATNKCVWAWEDFSIDTQKLE